MKNKAGVVVASVCFAAALMGLALSVGASSLAKAAGAEKLFSASEGVTLQRNFFIPDGTGDIKDPRSGLKVSASQAGKINTASAMAGDFELDFKVVSRATGINDFDLLTFVFTDENSGEEFKVYYDMKYSSEYEAKGIGKAFATFPNGYTKFGAYEGETLLDYQWGGVYVSSFNNKLSENKQSEAGSNRIKFLAEEKEVYIASPGGAYSKLIDFDDAKSCERAKSKPLTGFEKYRVSVEFGELRESVTTDAPAMMVLYSLNGQSLGGDSLTNDAGPSVSMRFEVMAVEGYAYRLPQPVQYDVIDGFCDYNGQIKVTTGGKEVPLSDGCIENPRFGKYMVSLFGATDKDGMPCKEVNLEFTVRLNHPGHEMTFQEKLISYRIGVGADIFIPVCSSFSKIGLYGESPTKRTIAIFRDNVKEETREMGDEGFFYRLQREGVYEIRYISADVIGHTVEESFTVTAEKNAPVLNVSAVCGIYKLGSTFVAPEAEARVNGVEVSPKKELISPFGELTQTLDVAGDYLYRVSYTVGGVEYFVQRGFSVMRGAEQLFENQRGSTIEADASSPEYAEACRGVKISAAKSNSTVRYVNPINITQLNGAVPLIEFLPLSKEKGIADFGMLTITLTDINNPKSSIGVKISRSYDRGYYWLSLVRAGINNANYAGWAWGQLKVDEGAGTNMTVSFLGEAYQAGMKPTTGSIYFDYASKTFYCSYFEDKLAILDLDSASDVGPGNEWMGFSSDYAYLTITANSLENRTGDYMVVSVAGQSLAGNYPESMRPVDFEVDMLGNDCAPLGKVNVKYPIFRATAFDNINIGIPFETHVFYRYNKSDQREVTVLDDYTFIPTQEGIYSILYSVGKTRKRVDITVGTPDPISYSPDEAYPNEIFVGKEFHLPGGTSVGGSGNKTIAYRAVYANGEELPVVAGTIKPVENSTITVYVRVTDYLGEYIEKSYKIRTVVSEKPVLSYEPNIAAAYIAGKTYRLPAVEGFDYTSGKGGVKAGYEIFIQSAGKETLLSGNIWTPSEADLGANDLRIVYRVYRTDKKTIFEEKSYEVRVIKPTFKDEYFISEEGISKQGTKDGMRFASTKNNSKLHFVNSVIDNFELMFSVETGNVGLFRLGITDSENADIRVEVTLKQMESKCYLFLNGERSGVMAGSFGGNAFTLALRDGEFYNGKDNICGAIEKLLSGKDFTGFPSGKVYLDFSFDGISNQAACNIMALNGQLLDDTDKDYMRPQIFVSKELKRTAKINETVVIPAAFAYDVLDPYTELKVTVKGPKGWTVFDNRPIDKDLTFCAERYGQYTVTYTAIDSRKNLARYPASVTVTDDIPPELKIEGEMPSVARIGEEVKFPSMSATDNTDGEVKVYLHYIDPYGKMIRIENFAFTPTMTGKYTITAFAKDSAYSYVRREFTLKVGK